MRRAVGAVRGGAGQTAKVEGRAAGDGSAEIVVRTDRGDVRAPFVVDALGGVAVLASPHYQPPDAPLSRGLEVHPPQTPRRTGTPWTSGSSATSSAAADRWRVPAGEARIGVGLPHHPARQGADERRWPSVGKADMVRYQGNWFPHRLRPAVEDDVPSVGDSAGHCFPLSGEGIRTAFYFGIAAGRQIGAALVARRTAPPRCTPTTLPRAPPPRVSPGASLQRASALPPRALTVALRALAVQPLTHRAFGRQLDQAHPAFARPSAPVRETAVTSRAVLSRRRPRRTGEVLTLAYANAGGRPAHARDRSAPPLEPLAPGTLEQKARQCVRELPSTSARCAWTATATRCSRSSSPSARPANSAAGRLHNRRTEPPAPHARRSPRSNADRKQPSARASTREFHDPPRMREGRGGGRGGRPRRPRGDQCTRVDEEAADAQTT